MLGTKILEEGESKFNGHLKVVRTLGLGTYIQADGLTQSGGIVKSIWKASLKKIRKRDVRSVLVLGLGGGTVVNLIKEFWPNAKIKGVDIDKKIVDLGIKYLGLNKADVDVKIGDAQNYSPGGKLFDLIIVDLYNGDNYPKKFATEKYMHFIKSLVNKSGMAIFNRLYYGDKRPETVKFGNKLTKIFSNVEWFYPEANLMLLCFT